MNKRQPDPPIQAEYKKHYEDAHGTDAAHWILTNGKIGEGKRKGSGYVTFHCPFHGDSRPSLDVSTRTNDITCRSQGCISGASLIDFVMKLDNVDSNEAVRTILGLSKRDVSARRAFVPELDDAPKNTEPRKLNSLHYTLLHPDLAINYFGGRGLPEKAVETHKLGASPKYRWRWTDLNGKEHASKTLRYTIPNIWRDEVRQVNARRDDVMAEIELLEMFADDGNMEGLVRNTLAKTLKTTPDRVEMSDMLDMVFGDKYLKWSKRVKNNVIYNVQVLMQYVGEQEGIAKFAMRKDLDYIIITEGEMDALSLCYAYYHKGLGFPAIAAKAMHNLDLKAALSKIPYVFVIADNDGLDKHGQPKGRKIAQDTAEAIGRPGSSTVKIITPEGKFKDANDVCLAGKAYEWLKQYRISPISYSRIYTENVFLAKAA